MSTRIALNGFGRMGRALFRVVLDRGLGLEVVAVNDLGSPTTMGDLLARDSVYGRLPVPVKVTEGEMVVGDSAFRILSEKEPTALPWRELDVDVVVDCTGRFRTRDAAAAHLTAGAGRVVVSAPCKDADNTIVLGVNQSTFDPATQYVVSNASCTTNCLVPMIKVLDDAFGVEQGFITTVHAYTGDQMLVDGPHKDPRRARAAAINIVPTSTGAARATGLVLPELEGRLDGTSLRVPVPDGSITDLVVSLGETVTSDAVNKAFRDAAAGPMGGIVEYSEEALVSTDIIGSPASCIFDAGLTMAGGHLAKVFGWYDNEWGYANRLAELTALVATA